uniref:RING-type domain-containing protein n=1 Tax=Panagrolaimus davidi TaxID=227884 RepID=A0A914PI52_9BILA
MSQESPEIGKCSICFSNINISNIYAISKCGHTFHQECIHQWISSTKNCPTCRTNAFQSDIIKLFIQENNAEISKKEEILPYIETKHTNYCHQIMKECKCEIFRYKIGGLRYKCLNDFNVQIFFHKKIDHIQILFPDEIFVKTFQSKRFEIIRGKTNRSPFAIVNANGERIEFKTQTMEGFLSNEDFIRQNVNRIKYCFPKFTIKRSLKNGENGKVTFRVYSNDPNKSLKIQICPEHQSFYVEHLIENKITRCTNSEFLCDHLQQ